LGFFTFLPFDMLFLPLRRLQASTFGREQRLYCRVTGLRRRERYAQ
jgi:hypothetical protein